RQSGLGGLPQEELPKGFPGLKQLALHAGVPPVEQTFQDGFWIVDCLLCIASANLSVAIIFQIGISYLLLSALFTAFPCGTLRERVSGVSY
ncbi:hypothetical protein BV372_24130, partial [Nostoc sp. T09]